MNDTHQDLDQNAQNILKDENRSDLQKYALLTAGTTSLAALLKYEMLTALFGGTSGALGLVLRSKAYRSLLAKLGHGAKIGRRVTFRGVNKIEVGNNVFIDDHCCIDARGESARVIIHDNVLISRNTVIRARNGTIEIGSGTDIGNNCIVSTDSRLTIGQKVLIAAFSYVCAGGNHTHADPEVPIIEQGFNKLGGATIGDGCWIGAHSSIFDGVEIGEHTIVGAHAMVNQSQPAFAVCVGAPARVIRDRRETSG